MVTESEFSNPGNATNGTAAISCAFDTSNKAFDQISFVIAISLALLAAVSNNLGVNLQKLAWTKKQRATSSVQRYRFIWVCGMVGIILASVFDFVALAFGPQSVIAPLGAFTMVMNACVAPWMHGERLPRIVYVATFIIVSGCATAVATASHENIICNLDGIFAFYLTPQSIVYFVFVSVLCSSVFLFIRYAERVLQEHKQDSDEYQRIFKRHRISYALVAGLMGAQSVVFARAVGMMFQASARGDGIFLARVQTYGILLGLILSIAIQLTYLNKGLARFESTYNVPTFTGTFIVSVAVAGGVVYGEFNQFSVLQAILFPLGVFMCIFGVSLLAHGGSADSDEASAATVEDEEDQQRRTMKSVALNSVVSFDISSSNPQHIEAPKPEALGTNKPGPSRASMEIMKEITRPQTMRIRSGGFFPFVIEENSHRRSTASSISRTRARTDTNGGGADAMNSNSSMTLKPNWLLGIRIDEEEDYVREGSTPSY